jgi:energy-coupling factor transport system ATP-binding protein
LRNFILQLNSQGKAVVMVTHDVEFVAECNPKVVLMSKGRIVAQGQADEILSDDGLIEKASLVKPQMAKLFSQLGDFGLPRDVVDVHRAKMLLEEKLSEVKVRVAQSS